MIGCCFLKQNVPNTSHFLFIFGVLGIGAWDLRMVGLDESAELWYDWMLTVDCMMKFKSIDFLKKWAIPGLFYFIFVFSIQLTVNVQFKCLPMTGFEPRTSEIWKLTLYQLSHNHCPLSIWL